MFPIGDVVVFDGENGCVPFFEMRQCRFFVVRTPRNTVFADGWTSAVAASWWRIGSDLVFGRTTDCQVRRVLCHASVIRRWSHASLVKLWARLARVILAVARAWPMVR